MKLLASSLVLAHLVVGVISSPTQVQWGPTLTERDITSVVSVLSSVDSAVNALDAAITASPPVPSAILPLAADLLAAINSGIQVVQASANLSTTDALSLIGPTQTLSSDTNTTINNLILIKSTLDAAGFGYTTLQTLQQQFTAASTLSADIVNLVPAALQSTAQSLAAGIAGAIQNGINAFAGETPPVTTTTTTSSIATTTTTTSTTTSTVSNYSLLYTIGAKPCLAHHDYNHHF